MTEYSDFYGLLGDNFPIEAVCPDYLPDSQCWATWRRDERGVAIISGYDPDEDMEFGFFEEEMENRQVQYWDDDTPDYWLPGDIL